MSLLDPTAMPHTVTIQRPKYTTTQYGGTTTTLINRQTGVKCRIVTASHVDIQEYDRRNQRITNMAQFATEPDLAIGDELKVTADDGDANLTGKSYLVQSFAEAGAGLGTNWTVALELENDDYENVHTQV